MLRFSANISMLFTEVPFLDRVGRAARAGFSAIECQFPYEWAASALRDRLTDHGLQLVLHNLPPGDWAAGDRGIACDPSRIGEFEESVARALEYATTLGCPQLNCLAGIRPADVSVAVARGTLIRNLAFAADAAKNAGIRILVEPINTRDMPGYLVNHTADGLALIRDAGADNLRLQYDCYHMQIMEGDLARTLEANLAVIGHIQVADPPLRHEPGTGEVNYPYLFERLERLGYAGWIGAEYHPSGLTEESLGWARPFLRRGSVIDV